MNKRLNRLALSAMRGLAIVKPFGTESGVELRNYKGRRKQAHELHWRCVEKMQHRWVLGLAVETEKCIHVQIVSPPDQCLHVHLIDSLTEAHAAMIREYEDEGIKVIGFGWTATIHDVTEDDVIGYLIGEVK